MKHVEPIEHLVERARGGDRGAFSQLVELHWSPLVRLARSVVGELEAEDAVQEALVTSWKKLARLRKPEGFAAWVRRIVLRACFRRTRNRRRWTTLDDAPEPTTSSSPAGRLDVERILKRLAPRQRAVMHLTLVEGMTDREIGDALGIAAASVRSHRRRARQSLSSWLGGNRT